MSNPSAYMTLVCPNCEQSGNMIVIDSRAVKTMNGVRRRRRCDHCGHRFTTYERLDPPLEDQAIARARGVLQVALAQLSKNISSSD